MVSHGIHMSNEEDVHIDILQFYIITQWKWSEVAQLSTTICDPMDCSLSGFAFHGVFQARVLEWGAIAFSSGK